MEWQPIDGPCRKCGTLGPRLEFRYGVCSGPERLRATCWRCGYLWDIQPLDARTKPAPPLSGDHGATYEE